MEQHEAAGIERIPPLAEQRRSSYLAVIGLMWDQRIPDENAGMGRAEQKELQEAWACFAERFIGDFVTSADVKRQHRWLANDLFISFEYSLNGGEHPEYELSKHVMATANRLELAFREEREKQASGSPGSKLRVGLSALAFDAETCSEVLYYEGMKQAIINAQSEGGAEQRLRDGYFKELLTAKSLYPVYQPIFSLQHGKIFGFEALTRLPVNNYFQGPMELFQFAEENGSVYRLDRLARELAIDGCLRLGQDQKLFINVMAQIMEDPRFSPGRTISLLEEHHLSPHQVVFEITERSSIEDYPSVKKALQHYRSQGYRIAIDDVGAGYSSLQSIVELRPDYMKIDRSIIQNVHMDEVKEHILTTLQDVAGKIGAELIAEGIERLEELDKLVRMGIPYAQGYLLGRPAPFPE